jgi:hypothetical protein
MTPLHYIGQWLRELFALIPLPVARALFLALPAVLLVWVLCLPRAAVTPPGRVRRWDENLKLWAGLALLAQLVIYAFL